MTDKDRKQAIEALTDLIDRGGFRLGSKLNYWKCLKNARTALETKPDIEGILKELRVILVHYIGEDTEDNIKDINKIMSFLSEKLGEVENVS